MRKPKEYAKVCWCWEDIKTLRPDWSRQRCEIFLQENSKHIAEAMVGTGWDALESLLAETGKQPLNIMGGDKR